MVRNMTKDGVSFCSLSTLLCKNLKKKKSTYDCRKYDILDVQREQSCILDPVKYLRWNFLRK